MKLTTQANKQAKKTQTRLMPIVTCDANSLTLQKRPKAIAQNIWLCFFVLYDQQLIRMTMSNVSRANEVWSKTNTRKKKIN